MRDDPFMRRFAESRRKMAAGPGRLPLDNLDDKKTAELAGVLKRYD